MKNKNKSTSNATSAGAQRSTNPTGGRPRPTRRKAMETVKAVLIALLAALILRQFVIASYNVPTGSMKDTILIGDFMFVNKFIYGARTPVWVGIPFTEIGFYVPHFRFPAIAEPKTNDIVVFDFPKEPRIDYIKRCVASGGETIEVKDRVLYRDGQPEGRFMPLENRFDPEEGQTISYARVIRNDGKSYVIRHALNSFGRNDNFGPVTIPQDHFFMMGDNRDNSLDSRFWGFVSRDQIGGKPLMIWLSWDTVVPGYRFYDKIRWSRLGSVLR